MRQNMLINWMKIPLKNVRAEKEKQNEERSKKVRPLFQMVKDILSRAIQSVDSNVMDTRAYMEVESHQKEVIHLREKFNYELDRIAYKIAFSTSSGADPEETKDSIFKILPEYSFEAQLILTLTAFALSYGECWRLALTYSSSQLAKSMVKQVASIHKQPGLSSLPLEAINDLVMAIIDVTGNIIKVNEIASNLTNHQNYFPSPRRRLQKLSNGLSEVSCYVISSTEKAELIYLTAMLNEKKRKLQNWQKIPTLEEITVDKRLKMIKSLIEVPQVDNMSILRALFYHKDDETPPLIQGQLEQPCHLEVLRKKLVLLLISDLDISQEDIDILNEIHSKSRDKRRNLPSRLEIVWLPIINSSGKWENEETENKYAEKQRAMEWYTVRQPSLIAKEVIKLVKDEWHFQNHPIIEVIDGQGEVVCPNAFPMIYIWRYDAYPFTTAAEEALWYEKFWDLELLMGDICPPDLELTKSRNNYICLYGGKNIEWIKMFTARAPAVAEAVGASSWEMVYVGNMSEPNETLQRYDTAAIEQEKMKSLSKQNQLKFWKRLENMGHSRMQLGKTIYDDTIMQDTISLLHLGENGGSWAAICYDLQFEIKAKGKQILNSFINFFEWKDEANKTKDEANKKPDFISALQNHLSMNPRRIDVIKHVENYERIITDNFKRTREVDSVEVLKALISAKDDRLVLNGGATKKRKQVNLDPLKRKEFLFLLVSNCNISTEVGDMLGNVFKQGSDKSDFVWLQVVDASKKQPEKEQSDIAKKNQMSWDPIYRLSVTDQAAIKFIKEVWHFEKKPILVVLDKNGRVVSPNALHMIWEKNPISFITSERETTTSREEAMTNENWSPDFIIANLDTKISDWLNEDKVICLYGGEDINWIYNFTSNAKQAAKYANIPLEMLYVGKSNLKSDQVARIIKKIEEEKLSNYWGNLTMQSFWYRIQSMWISRYQQGKSVKKDGTVQVLTTILEFDSSEGGWAIMSKGSGPGEMVKAKGSDFLDCLLDYREWIDEASEKGFMATLKENLKKYHNPQDCYQLLLPEFFGTKLDTTECLHCNRTTERFISFKCCGK